jgi:hypothetical protein
MESFDQARETIYKELTSNDSELRAEYLALFEADVKTFAEEMAHAVMAWRSLDAEVKGDEKRGYVAALVCAAYTMHILSFKLFLSGHIVAAGNVFRQVLESIALALLCAGKDLGVLERFMEDRYSANDAVRDVLRHGKKLQLKEDGLQALKSSQEFYHKYSHITRLTLATIISFSEDGTYIGASFDKGKIEAYRKEVNGRVGLAKVFTNFVEAVKANVAKW